MAASAFASIRPDPVRAPVSDERDPHLDAVCRTAAALFGARYAFVTQLDADCQWFLGREGLAISSTPRAVAFCALTILGAPHEPLVVLDTLNDPRFATNPLVTGEPFLRFYAGVPISFADGINVATVCIADPSPRVSFTEEEQRRLCDLALFVEATLRGRIAQADAEQARAGTEEAYATLRAETAQRTAAEVLAAGRQTQLQDARDAEHWAEEAAGFGRWTIDVAAGSVIWSMGMAHLLGREDWAERTISLQQHIACYHPSERALLRAVIRRDASATVSRADGTFIRRGRMLRSDGAVRDVVVHGRTARDATGAVTTMSGITLDVTDLARSERELQASEVRLRTILDHIDQGLVMTDADDRVRVYNRRVASMMGVPRDLLRDGAVFADVRAYQAAGGEFAHLPEPLKYWLERGDPEARIDDYERTRPDGTVLHVRTLPLPGGGLVRTFTDVTQRRAAEAAVRESERRFRLLAENSNDVFVLGDLDMRRLYVSPAVRTMLGYEPEELVGSTPLDFAHPDDAHIFSDLWAKVQSERDGRFIACMRYRHKAGHHVWIEASVSLARESESDEVIGYVAALRDVTTRREAEEQVRHMALHDALTGLPNRTLFRDRLDQAIAHAARSGNPFAVLACDLDRFKAVNDSLGHQAGDALLRVVADRMQAVLRPYDTVARLGGDEFAIVLTYLDEPCSAARLAERLITAVSEPIDLDGQIVEVGVSIGVTLATEPDASADELFKRADIALYEAKAAGRNTYREFEVDAGARVATRSQLGLDMKEAIRRGEFRLVYQPVVDAATGTVVSFEALMRWCHPVQGEISPGTFIPLAEETGLIVPLGIWALREACREAMNWPAHIRVAVNVSAIQLRREGLEAAVLSALASSGLPAVRLKLEVTESVLMQDSDLVLACLHRLRGLGVLVALDDFGTGYSSLSYLRRFPFDKIKIDRAFIRDIADPDAAAIVRAVVSIGERLGMGIVAEGVETTEQLDLVRREGCTLVQGFLFSRPLPPHEARLYVEAAQASAA